MKFLYKFLALNFYYLDFLEIYKKLTLYSFFYLNFKNEDKRFIPVILIYLSFFFSLKLNQFSSFILLKKSIRRYQIFKNFPLGIKFSLHLFYKIKILLFLFSYFFYYNIFGELKKFLLDRKRGLFIIFKFPVLNFFYLLNFNIITLFLFSLEIPDINFLISIKNTTLNETKAIRNFFLLF